MLPAVSFADEEKAKLFIGFLGDAKYSRSYWNARARSNDNESVTPSSQSQKLPQKLSVKEQLFIKLLPC